MLRRFFSIFALILVLALSVVPAFASEVESDSDSDPEDWFVDLPTDISVTYNLSFQDSYIEDFNIHSFKYPLFPYIPLTGVVDFVSSYTYPKLEVEQGERVLSLGLTNRGSSLINNYSHFSNSGSVRFDYSSSFSPRLDFNFASWISYLNFWEFSSGDFFAFSHESFDNVESDQNSQILLMFEQSFLADYCDVSKCSVSFSYAPVTDSGLGSFEEFSSDFSSFAFKSGTKYVVDPGRLFRKPTTQGDNDFYLIRDFSIVLTPNSSYYLQSIQTPSYGSTFTFAPSFTCSFVYASRFDDPSFLNPPGGMELRDYTAWITTAVSGFFEIQIFPGFYLSGFLMVVIAFACVIWFLKIFAGG